MDELGAIGFMAGMLTTIGYVPQLVKGVRTKSMNDISLAMPIVLGVGLTLWTIYGIVLNSFPIIFWDSIALALLLSIIALKLKYRRSGLGSRPAQSGETVGQE